MLVLLALAFCASLTYPSCDTADFGAMSSLSGQFVALFCWEVSHGSLVCVFFGTMELNVSFDETSQSTGRHVSFLLMIHK